MTLQDERGMTLLELLVTLAISSVLFLMASHSYQSLQLTLHEELIRSEFMQDLKLAKNLASIEERAISLCHSHNGKECLNDKDIEWFGWLLFYDDSATFKPLPDSIIHYLPPKRLQEKGLYLLSSANIGGGINIKARRQYAYGMGRSLPNGRIKLCYNNHNLSAGKSQTEHYAFIINVYGYFRISKEKGAC
ncbi:prepilin-type N-terminal cleavage/methylation domain-containing protein [Ignatzschineria sp. LJL83]